LGFRKYCGDDKAADSIEDTAVELSDLPNYIADFSAMMKSMVRMPSIGARRSRRNHLRPILNLKQKKDYINLGAIATEVAVLVKKTEARWWGAW
jgi:hypothetical protein